MPVFLRKLGNRTEEIDGSTFTVRVVDAEEEAAIMDNLFKLKSEGSIKFATGEVSLLFVKDTLIGWKDVKDLDEKGNPVDVKFDKEKIKLLPSATILKLADLAKGEQLPKEEVKK